jgi:hypothetical protein
MYWAMLTMTLTLTVSIALQLLRWLWGINSMAFILVLMISGIVGGLYFSWRVLWKN